MITQILLHFIHVTHLDGKGTYFPSNHQRFNPKNGHTYDRDSSVSLLNIHNNNKIVTALFGDWQQNRYLCSV